MRGTFIAGALALALAPQAAHAAHDRTIELSGQSPAASWTTAPQTQALGTYDPAAPCPPERCDTTLVRVGELPQGSRAVLDVGLRALRPAGPNQLEVAVFSSDAAGTKGELLNRSFGFLASEELAPVAAEPGHLLVEVHNGGSVATTYTGTLDLRLHDVGGGRPDGGGVPATRVTRGPGAHLDPDAARRGDLVVAVSERFDDPRARLLAERDVRVAASHASFDGGRTWADAGDLTDARGGFPRVALGPDGDAWAVTTDTSGNADGLRLHRWRTPSREDVEAGRTWEPATTIVAASERPGPVLGTELGRGALAVLPSGAIVVCTSHVQTAQPVAFVRCLRSADQGASWTPSVLPAARAFGYGPDLAVAPDGTLHLVQFDATGNTAGFAAPGTADRLPSATLHARSTDGGATFSVPRVVLEGPDMPYAFVHPPVSTLPRVAAGPAGPCVAGAVWDGARPDVLLTCERGGAWSAPASAHAATAGSQDVPGLGIAPSGRVDVAWSDRRRDAAGPANDGDWWTDEVLRRGDGPEQRLSQRARAPQDGAVLRGFFTPNAVSPVSLTRAVLSTDDEVLVVSSDVVPGEALPQLVVRRR